MKSPNPTLLALIAVAGFLAWTEFGEEALLGTRQEPVEPNWRAIASWPQTETGQVAAQPDPNRRFTTIVLDDSGSMTADFPEAKQAIVDALDAMEDSDRVAVVALNAGIVMPFTNVVDARTTLTTALGTLRSDGRTPLTKAVQNAQQLLEVEASRVRGFGTFRLIVTTDGEADNGTALDAAVESIAATTPIQLTTIGIDISGGHVLRRSDLGSFVDVANVAALKSALQAAVAENTDFTAITNFNGSGG